MDAKYIQNRKKKRSSRICGFSVMKGDRQVQSKQSTVQRKSPFGDKFRILILIPRRIDDLQF